MQASAMRLDVASKLTPNTVEATAQAWHRQAWLFYDRIGEIKGGGRFMENACARVQIALGILPGVGEDPVALHDAAERGLISGAPGSPETEVAQEDPVVSAATLAIAEGLFENLVNGQEGEGALLGAWGSKSFVVGEGYVVGWVDQETFEERWLCVSSDEIVTDERASSGQAQILIRRSPKSDQSGTGLGFTSDIRLPADAFLMRVWRRHSRYGDLSDSNLHGCLEECEELRVIDLSIKATALSRIPANILAVSSAVDPRPVALEPDEDDETENAGLDPLLVQIAEHMSTPIAEPGSASATVPFLMRIPEVEGVSPRDLAFMIEVGRPLDPEVLARAQYLRERIAATVELPSSQILGTTADANHWSAWLIDEETYRLYVAPTVQPFVEALTTKYLRPRLVESGITPEEADHFVFYGDERELVTRPNRVENATAGHSALAISDEAFRDALGFTDADAPTPEEVVRRIIERQTVLPAEVIPLLNQIYGLDLKEPETTTPPGAGGTPAPPGGNKLPGPPGPPGEQTDPSSNGGSGSGDIPTTGSALFPIPILTSVSAEGVVFARRRTTGQRLAAIDRRLRERLLVAADAAVARAVERAGAKLRSSLSSAKAGTMRADVKAQVVAVPNRFLLSSLGRARIESLAVDPSGLFSGDFDDLEERWDDWLAGAQDDVVAIASKTLGVDPTGEAIASYRAKSDDRRRAGWLALSAGLLTIARSSVFDLTPAAVLGETSSTTVPMGLIRDALARAGGTDPIRTAAGGVKDASTGGYAGGIATGDDAAALWGSLDSPFTGFEWVYNDEGQRTFEPHFALFEGPDGGPVQFSDWEDPVLSTAGTDGEWIGEFFFPGDHGGCRCDAIPIILGEG